MRILVVVAALALVAGCSTGTDAVATGTDFQFVSPGGKLELFYEGDDRQQIPEMSGEDLMNEGEELNLSSFKGKVVVLNIWGEWCPPCRAEAPQLQTIYEELKDDGLEVLGIDVRDHDRTAPQDFMRDTELTYPSIYDPSSRSLLALKGYPRTTVPSTIVLDTEHRVAAIFLRDVHADDLRPLAERLLAEKMSRARRSGR